jgi:hypothetical protein
MRSWVASLWLGIAAACGGSPDVVEAPVEAPVDWTGPQIIASDTAAGLAIECTAPTLGCAFELESATAVGDVTEVRCRYTTAGQAIVGPRRAAARARAGVDVGGRRAVRARTRPRARPAPPAALISRSPTA